MEIVLGTANIDGESNDPAYAECHSRRGRVVHVRIEDDRARGAPLVRCEPVQRAGAARLFLAFDHDPHVDRQGPLPGAFAGRIEQRVEVALVVARPAPVQAIASYGRFEWGRGPSRYGIGGLHVVMTVDEDRGGIRNG